MFYNLASNCRYAYITNIENYINIGDLSDALSLVNTSPEANPQYDHLTGVVIADSTGADTVVKNYQRFYKSLIRYIEDSMSSTDSANVVSIAYMCPMLNGLVVYQARALYAMVFNTAASFDDESCNIVDEGRPGNNVSLRASTYCRGHFLHVDE